MFSSAKAQLANARLLLGNALSIGKTDIQLQNQDISPEMKAILDDLKNYRDNGAYGLIGEIRVEQLRNKMIELANADDSAIDEMIGEALKGQDDLPVELKRDKAECKKEIARNLILAKTLKAELMSDIGSTELRFALIKLYIRQFALLDEMQGKEKIIVLAALDFIQKIRGRDKERALQALEVQKRKALEKLFTYRLNSSYARDDYRNVLYSNLSLKPAKGCPYLEMLVKDHNIYSQQDRDNFLSEGTEEDKKQFPQKYFYHRFYNTEEFLKGQRREFSEIVEKYAKLRDEVYNEINNDADLVKVSFNELLPSTEDEEKARAERIAKAKSLVLAFFGKSPEQVEELISDHYEAIKLVMIDREPEDLIQKEEKNTSSSSSVDNKEKSALSSPPIDKDYYDTELLKNFILDICAYTNQIKDVYARKEGLQRAVRIYLSVFQKREEILAERNNFASAEQGEISDRQQLHAVVLRLGEVIANLRKYQTIREKDPSRFGVDDEILKLIEEKNALQAQEAQLLQRLKPSMSHYIKSLIVDRKQLTTSKVLRYSLIRLYNKHFLAPYSSMSQVFAAIHGYIRHAKNDKSVNREAGIERAENLAYKYFLYAKTDQDILDWLSLDIHTSIGGSTSQMLLNELKAVHNRITGREKPAFSLAGRVRCLIDDYCFQYLMKTEQIVQVPELGERDDIQKVIALLDRINAFNSVAGKPESDDALCKIIIENFIKTFMVPTPWGGNSSAGNKLYLAICEQVFIYLAGEKESFNDYYIQGLAASRDAVLLKWEEYKNPVVAAQNGRRVAPTSTSSSSSSANGNTGTEKSKASSSSPSVGWWTRGYFLVGSLKQAMSQNTSSSPSSSYTTYRPNRSDSK